MLLWIWLNKDQSGNHKNKSPPFIFQTKKILMPRINIVGSDNTNQGLFFFEFSNL